jgi:fluoride exporter
MTGEQRRSTAANSLVGASRLARALGAADELPLDPDLADADIRTGRHASSRSEPGHRALPSLLAAVFAGGFAGTLCRYLVERTWPTPPGRFPLATFLINTSGAFLLGLVLTVLIERAPHRSRWLAPRPLVGASMRAFVGAGLLGGWTTYSTLAVEAVALGRHGSFSAAAGYLALSLVCGTSAAAGGIAIGRSRALDDGPAERAASLARARAEDSTQGGEL